VHRDIKSGNVILTPDDRPYLVDFGAVQTRLRSADSVGSTIVGTLGYMPLEQIRGQAVPASDLYALGMTLIVALAGQPIEQLPVDESTGKVAIARALPTGTPKRLVDALDAMIEVLTSHRAHSAKEVLARLDAPSRAIPLLAPPDVPGRTGPRMVGSVVGLILVLGIAAEVGGLVSGHDAFGLFSGRRSSHASPSSRASSAASSPIAAPPNAPSPPFLPAPSYVGELSNGLSVIVLEDHDPPVVAVRLVYRLSGGQSADGVQLIAPRVMLESSEHVATGEYESLLGAAGARGTTWGTKMDQTYFATTVPTARIELPLWAWSDQMAFVDPRVDEGAVRRARDVAVQDSRIRYDEVACAGAEQAARDALYPDGHPYRRTPAKVPESADGIDSSRLRAFLKSVYVPARAALVFVGDVSAERAMTLASKWFGDVSPGTRGDPGPPEGLPSAEAHVAVRARVDHPQVRLVWRIPRANDDPLLWETLAQLLDGDETRMMAWELADRQKIVSRANASYSARAFGSVFSVDTTLEPGHSPAEVVKGVDGMMRSWIQNPTRLSWAVREAERARLLNSETTADRASWLANDWVQSGRSPTEWTMPTQATLLKAVDSALVPAHRVVIDCEPDRVAPIAGVVDSRGP
jgi:predicted Zn-dependent peptidase